MKGVLFATKPEATPLLDKLSRIAERYEIFDIASVFIVRDQTVAVSVVGMGKPSARQGTLRFIERFSPKCLINAGIAGALSDALEIGRVFRVSSSVDWPSMIDAPIEWSSRGFGDLPCARLVTVGEPVFDSSFRNELIPLGDMVDMEGAAAAAVARASNIECIGVKCISDFAKDGDRDTLHANLHRASEMIAETLIDRIR